MDETKNIKQEVQARYGAVESLTSYGLENLDALDETARQTLTKGVDWSTVPDGAGLYSARIVAKKPD